MKETIVLEVLDDVVATRTIKRLAHADVLEGLVDFAVTDRAGSLGDVAGRLPGLDRCDLLRPGLTKEHNEKQQGENGAWSSLD